MTRFTCECMSPQEQRLYDKIEGKEDRFRETHSRVFKMLERFDGQKPRIDIERALYFTQSMQETEGQPLVLRWAKAMKHIAENMTVYVQDDQLLLGRAGCDGRYGILYPELDGDFLDIAVKELPNRPTSPATITPEDAKVVVEHCYWPECGGSVSEQTLNGRCPDVPGTKNDYRLGVSIWSKSSFAQRSANVARQTHEGKGDWCRDNHCTFWHESL